MQRLLKQEGKHARTRPLIRQGQGLKIRTWWRGNSVSLESSQVAPSWGLQTLQKKPFIMGIRRPGHLRLEIGRSNRTQSIRFQKGTQTRDRVWVESVSWLKLGRVFPAWQEIAWMVRQLGLTCTFNISYFNHILHNWSSAYWPDSSARKVHSVVRVMNAQSIHMWACNLDYSPNCTNWTSMALCF